MRELLLMRHAEAAAASAGAGDFTRPLTSRGGQSAIAAAKRLAGEQWVPDFLLFSPAKRTADTAAAVRATLALTDVPASADARVYLATAGLLLKILGELPDAAQRVLLIAHNPAISELAELLQPQAAHRSFATAEFRHLRLSIDDWRDLDAAA